MKTDFKPSTDETQFMIILGIIIFYLIVTGFVLYLYLLSRITIVSTIISIIVFTVIYLPRLNIIKKINNKDQIKILDDSILINTHTIKFSDIEDFRTSDKKPQVVFFINNKMIVFNETTFHLKLRYGEMSFSAIGSEKIKLLKEFLSNLKNYN